MRVSFWAEPRHLYVEMADYGRWRRPNADPGHRGRLIMQQVVGSVFIHKDLDDTRVLLRHPHRLVATSNAAVDVLTSD